MQYQLRMVGTSMGTNPRLNQATNILSSSVGLGAVCLLLIALLGSCTRDPCERSAVVASTPSLSRVMLNVSSRCGFSIRLRDSLNGQEREAEYSNSTMAIRIDVSPRQVNLVEEPTGKTVITMSIASDCYSRARPALMSADEMQESDAIAWTVGSARCGEGAGKLVLAVLFHEPAK